MISKLESSSKGIARLTLDVAVAGEGKLSSTKKSFVLDNGRIVVGDAIIQITVYRKA